MRPITLPWKLSASSGVVRSVWVRPGCTTVTLMPWRPSSSARFLVRADTATLRTDPMTEPVWRAARPLTLMMRPQPWAIIPGATSRAQRRYPMTLVLTSPHRASVVISASFGGALMPPGMAAAFTRMSTPPRAALSAVTMPCTDSSSPVSHAWPTTVRPVAAASSSTAPSIRAWSRAAMPRSTPSRASWRAIAFPMPRLPPVTMARFPVSSKSITGTLRLRPQPPVPESGPGQEQAERMAGGVEHDAHVVLGLELGLGRAELERPGHGRLQFVGADVDMGHHLLLARLVGPGGPHVLVLALERQAGPAAGRPDLRPLGVVADHRPAEELTVEAGQALGIRRPQHCGRDLEVGLRRHTSGVPDA